MEEGLKQQIAPLKGAGGQCRLSELLGICERLNQLAGVSGFDPYIALGKSRFKAAKLLRWIGRLLVTQPVRGRTRPMNWKANQRLPSREDGKRHPANEDSRGETPCHQLVLEELQVQMAGLRLGVINAQKTLCASGTLRPMDMEDLQKQMAGLQLGVTTLQQQLEALHIDADHHHNPPLTGKEMVELRGKLD